MTSPSRCDHCAHALPPGVRYCPKCGAVASTHTPTGEAPARVPAFVLVHRPGSMVHKCELARPIVRIGRGSDCEVSVDHPRVSRIHAVLEIRDNAWHLSDAKSSGGTFLGDRPVHGAVTMKSGDTIRLGREPGDAVTLVFHLGS